MFMEFQSLFQGFLYSNMSDYGVLFNISISNMMKLELSVLVFWSLL